MKGYTFLKISENLLLKYTPLDAVSIMCRQFFISKIKYMFGGFELSRLKVPHIPLTGECAAEKENFCSSSLRTCLHHTVILRCQYKITDFL